LKEVHATFEIFIPVDCKDFLNYSERN
jgi:hypothetical protein